MGVKIIKAGGASTSGLMPLISDPVTGEFPIINPDGSLMGSGVNPGAYPTHEDMDTYAMSHLVRYDAAQPSITPAQQAQARANIGVVTAGGVAYSSGTHTSSITTLPSEGSLFVDFTTANTALGVGFIVSNVNNDAGYGNISLNVEADGRLVAYICSGVPSEWTRITAPAGTIEPGKRYSVVFNFAPGSVVLYINGAAVGTTSGNTYTRFTSNPFGALLVGRTYGGTPFHFAGTITTAHIFNRALTADERAAVMRGEVPAAKDVGGVSSFAMSGTWTELNSPAASGVTINTNAGGVLDVASTAAPNYYFSCGSGADNTAPLVKVGRTIRLRYKLTVTSGTVYYIPTQGGGGIGYTAGLNIAVAGTSVTVDLTVDATRTAGGGIGLRLYFGTATFRLENVSLEILGTVARYEPENVTSLGRWLDSSGNGYDLIPGAGITPLKPQPVQVRTAAFTFDMTGTVPSRVRGPITVAKGATGIVDCTFSGYLSDSVKYPTVAFRGVNSNTRGCLANPEFTTNGVRFICFDGSRNFVDDTIDAVVGYVE